MEGLAAISPVTKHKNVDKVARSQAKEWKTSSRHISASGSVSANAYNPVSGTFHCLDGAASDSASTDQNGKPGITEDTNNSINAAGTNAEYDSVSTNGSCSGESEDQPQVLNKEKRGNLRTEAPVLVGQCDKRDKSRVRNEKKHQRQKERRAKELRDRSTSFIISHKLKVLTEQLVGMGFSPEHASMALILNNGHVENSIACLLEGREERLEKSCNSQIDVKLDISEELTRILEFETEYNTYSRSEIDKAIVACEGDLDKAVEWLRDRHPDRLPVRYIDPSNQRAKHDLSDQLEHQMHSAISGTVSTSPAHSRNSNKPQAQANHHKEEMGIIAEKNIRDQLLAPAPRRPSERTAETFSIVRSTLLGSSNSNKPLISGDGQEILDGLHASLHIPQLTIAPVSTSLHLLADCNSFESARSFWSSLRDASMLQASKGEGMTQQGSQNWSSMRDASMLQASKGEGMTHQVLQQHSASQSQAGGSNCVTNSPTPFQRQFLSTSSSTVLHLNGESNKQLVDRRGISVKGIEHGQAIDMVDAAEHIRPLHPSCTVDARRTLNQNLLHSLELPFYASSFACTPQLRIPSNISSELWTGWGSGAPVDWSLQSIRNRDYKSVDWSMSAPPSALWETPISIDGSSSQTVCNISKFDRNLHSLNISDHSVRNPPRSVAMTDTYDLWGNSKFRDDYTTLGTLDESTSEIANSSPVAVQEWTSPFAGKDLFTLPRQTILSTL
ncbi:hypothetical protein O6H91_17G025900 [Diphasiastrum complanatum]|uniref:Uncharacterized protein n=1 Tax=Diphasiastrum complanatum TaxID=34168 RepID=A0ACC2B512_DIPCM|nr:hypothetical protein O6H91_17G025900 [Diphasiastrum complanatum]